MADPDIQRVPGDRAIDFAYAPGSGWTPICRPDLVHWTITAGADVDQVLTGLRVDAYLRGAVVARVGGGPTLLDLRDDEEGVPATTGFLSYRGVWTYAAAIAANVWLYAGRPDKAIDYLYAFANHAYPTRVWREEQPLRAGGHWQLCGDMPHNWASAEFIRLVRHLLVFERDDGLELLPGLPPEWVYDGASLRVERTPHTIRRREPVAARGGRRVLAHGRPAPARAPGPEALHARRPGRLRRNAARRRTRGRGCLGPAGAEPGGRRDAHRRGRTVNVSPGLGVVVTGGAGDIGRAIARELLGYGARLTLLDRRSPADTGSLLSELDSLGPVAYEQVDVRDAEAVAAALARVDPLDVVVGNAGVVESAPFLEITPDQWRTQLEVNLTGCFNVGQAAARLMVERGRPGRVICTSSWVQDVAWPEICAYSVSKAGLKMLTRCMAAELASERILVNAVAPGIVAAGMARHQLETEPQYAARVAEAIPLGRLQTAEEVARAVAVLCSDAADYMTGTVLLADGGSSLRVGGS